MGTERTISSLFFTLPDRADWISARSRICDQQSAPERLHLLFLATHHAATTSDYHA